jgi:hypothetical protein
VADETRFERVIDMQDARPRMAGEPGDHTLSLTVSPPPGLDADTAVELRLYPDGRLEVYDMDGTRLACARFERNESGEEVFTFVREDGEDPPQDA